MNENFNEIEAFYTRLFAEDLAWTKPFPNLDEARRWAKIGEFLSQIAYSGEYSERPALRILDVGCGNGWLTHLASVYGHCEGLDPVAGSIKLARRSFPDLTFYVGTTADLLQSQNFKPYDVIITSEVIEHVIDKESFVAELRMCLASNGHVILTTPRGEEFKKWRRLGWEGQPVEAWISERELRLLFERHQFVPIANDRIYIQLPNMFLMSFLHRLCVSPKFSRALDMLRLSWLLKGLEHLTAIYQVWWFRLPS